MAATSEPHYRKLTIGTGALRTLFGTPWVIVERDQGYVESWQYGQTDWDPIFRSRACGEGAKVRLEPLAEAHLNFADKSSLHFRGPLLIDFDPYQYDSRFDGAVVSQLRAQAVRRDLWKACGGQVRFQPNNVPTLTGARG